MIENNKEKYMREALKEARKAYTKLEVPVGAIIVRNNKIIARAYNKRERDKIATSHAEILAIKKACRKLKNWRLTDCEMYITLEPCAMCAGAIINARINKIYIGTKDLKTGACGSKLNLLQDYHFDTSVDIEDGILQEECQKILKDFFKEIRKVKNRR